ncbi:ferritin family protein [Anaeromyxobacter sp. SG17]|uniref:ferritin-like domain-containing protein n=1 Tax=Anaeromyxobacter sp. SG17 TaxID=2925405 RepID=UPI001F56AFC5|nr:ferritin family protein [Anaeromyxobacter sp. SG17]
MNDAAIDFAKLNLQDALDLAILIEEEARDRYQEFTRIVGGRYAGDASDMFMLMASYEKRHGTELAERRRARFGDAPRRVSREQLYDIEAPDPGQPRVFMSARQALEVALSSEKKAFDFFSSALPYVKDPDVRALFEELRAEEQKHQTLVRDRLEKLPPGPDVEEEDADEPGSDPGN